MKKRFLILAVLYSAYTVYLFYKAKTDESITLGVMFIAVIFWIIGGAILGLLLFFTKTKELNKKDYIAIVFCTPAPTWFFLFIVFVLPSLFQDVKYATIGKIKYYPIDSTKTVTYRRFFSGGLKKSEEFKQDRNGKWLKHGEFFWRSSSGDTDVKVYRNDTLIRSYSL
ncbi:MAG: hypothetical protein ACLGGV_01980 [Bacteroidia bacterium]